MAIISIKDKEYFLELKLCFLYQMEKKYKIDNFMMLTDIMKDFSASEYIDFLYLLFKANNINISKKDLIDENLSLHELLAFLADIFNPQIS